MIKQETIQKEINDLVRYIIEDKPKNFLKEGRRLAFLRDCLAYLNTGPNEEFLKTEKIRLINIIKDREEAKKKNPRYKKSKDSVEKAFKTISFLLNE